jgi:hypothetical protein
LIYLESRRGAPDVGEEVEAGGGPGDRVCRPDSLTPHPKDRVDTLISNIRLADIF